MIVALLLGITGSGVGSGRECAAIAIVETVAAPVVFLASEARKNQLENEWLEVEGSLHGESPPIESTLLSQNGTPTFRLSGNARYTAGDGPTELFKSWILQRG